MDYKNQEVCRTDPNCFWLEGLASWDNSRKSFKYGWRTSNGRFARGGEFPVEALPQLLEFAVRCGYKLNF